MATNYEKKNTVSHKLNFEPEIWRSSRDAGGWFGGMRPSVCQYMCVMWIHLERMQTHMLRSNIRSPMTETLNIT